MRSNTDSKFFTYLFFSLKDIWSSISYEIIIIILFKREWEMSGVDLTLASSKDLILWKANIF